MKLRNLGVICTGWKVTAKVILKLFGVIYLKQKCMAFDSHFLKLVTHIYIHMQKYMNYKYFLLKGSIIKKLSIDQHRNGFINYRSSCSVTSSVRIRWWNVQTQNNNYNVIKKLQNNGNCSVL